MDYFAGCTTEAERKARYRQHASVLHPDKGGDTAKFQEMKRQYERGYHDSSSNSQSKPHNDKTEYVNLGGTRYRVVQRFSALIDPDSVKNSSWTYRDDEGKRWTFNPNKFRQGEERYITDSEVGSCIHVRAAFGCPTLKGSVEISDIDILHRRKIVVQLFAQGIHFADMEIPDHNDYKRFMCGGDTSITCQYSKKHITRVYIRPDVEWTYDEKAIEIKVSIVIVDKAAHVMENGIPNRPFLQRLKLAWDILKG